MTRAFAHRFKLATTALPVLLAVVALGCGSDNDEGNDTTELVEAQKDEVNKAGEITTPIDASDVVKGFPPSIITDGDVDAEKKGTPERAFLEWWQAAQFHDFNAVEGLTSKATLDAVGKSQLEELVNTLTLQGVEVLDVSESGNSAQVNAGLLTFQPPEEGAPPPNKPTNSVPETFAMSKEGDWTFAESEYLELRLEGLQGQ